MISKFHNDPNFRWWNVFQTSSFILFSKLSCVEFEIMCNKSSDWNDLWVGNSAKIIMSNKKSYIVELWVGLIIIEDQYVESCYRDSKIFVFLGCPTSSVVITWRSGSLVQDVAAIYDLAVHHMWAVFNTQNVVPWTTSWLNTQASINVWL